MRKIWLLAMFANVAVAQFQDLAATGDGSRLLFSTAFRLKASNQASYPKIFEWTADGAKLLAERLPAYAFQYAGDGPTIPYLEILPDVSGDGSVIAINSQSTCCCGSHCEVWRVEQDHFAGEVRTSDNRPLESRMGRVSLSRNGQFAVYEQQEVIAAIVLSDLSNHTSITVPLPGQDIDPVRRAVVTSTGTALAVSYSTITAANATGTRTYTLKEHADTIASDDNGETVLFDTRADDGPQRIIRLDPDTGAETVLFQRARRPSLSRDGRTLLFLSDANLTGSNSQGHTQAFLANIDSSGLRQLTRSDDDVFAATLAGGGGYAFASTTDNRLLRINVQEGSVEEIVGRTPSLSQSGFSRAPGSFLTLTGAGLPLELKGTQVLIGGMPVPILQVSASEIDVQMPWEIAPGLSTLEMTSAGSVFESLQYSLSIVPVDPLFFQSGLYTLAAHAGFESLVTPDHPARAGEIIHVYATGLGPVQPPVPTGMASPADPPAQGVAPDCRVGTTPIEVLFAGLAPGFVGIYQIDMRLPDPISGNRLTCGSASGTLALSHK